MRIYNKKTFWWGMFYFYLSINWGIKLIGKALEGMQFDILVLIALCVLLGFTGLSDIRRGLSKKLSKADKLEELDERNRFILLKSNSKAYHITELGSGVMVAVFGGIGLAMDSAWLKGMALGALLCFLLSFFANMCAEIYYK